MGNNWSPTWPSGRRLQAWTWDGGSTVPTGPASHRPRRPRAGGQDVAGQDVAGQDVAGQDLAGQDLAGRRLVGHGLEFGLLGDPGPHAGLGGPGLVLRQLEVRGAFGSGRTVRPPTTRRPHRPLRTTSQRPLARPSGPRPPSLSGRRATRGVSRSARPSPIRTNGARKR